MGNDTAHTRPPASIDQPHSLSLLWPPGSQADPGAPLGPSAQRDLGLAELARAFTPDQDRQKEILKILSNPSQDTDIIHYRQEVLEDLLHHPQLAKRLEALLPTIDALSRFSFQGGKDMTTLHEITWRMGELQSIVDCMEGLGEIFDEIGDQLQSRGWRALKKEIAAERADPAFKELAQQLPQLMAQLRSCASVTIGVNLDQYLRPVQATLLSVNEQKFTNESLLGGILGKRGGLPATLAPLHSVPRRETEGAYALPIDAELGWGVEPLMVPLFRDLAKVIEKTTRPIARALDAYAQIHSRQLVRLRQDLAFYLGARRFILRLRKHGLPTCRPELAPRTARLCQVEGLYNANLALRLGQGDPGRDLAAAIVRNALELGTPAQVLILTGPNQGGKTTYLQAAGLAQLLAQAGLHVPGEAARVSPVDGIYTHFPLEEKPGTDTGRFGEEAQRLAEIFRHITRHSLVLLNESLASTNAGESLYLAQDVVRILRRLACRAIYSTHLHELAARTEQLNAETPGNGRITSLVASPVEEQPPAGADIRRSYKIEARPPVGRSYAREIASRYGLDYEQLERQLAERGQLQDGEAD